jgi:hypothetical protein
MPDIAYETELKRKETMVGFKSIWLLLSLLLFAACVPQTKQTECKSNEAFNATLRTCVPVVPGTDSFININSFLPTQTLTKYKNDTTPITFSITVSNPYAQPYSIQWERIYNGVPIPIAPAIPTAHTFAPSLLATEVGTHIISVKILNASNVIVDNHSFELKINDNPKPVIQSASVTPPLYASTYTPSSLPQNFAFTVYNNGAAMSGAGYRTDWKLYRSGVLIDSETDVFPTGAPVGSLSSTGYNYPVYTFNPVLIDGIAIGAYTVNARVTNSANEVVAEQQWSATVTHPPLAKITNRDIYSGSSSPAFAAVTTAYNNVAYTGSPAYNFIPAGGATQGDYCVAVSNGEGTYAGDGLFVRVDYYLDGGTLVYSNLTTAVDNKVCLTDAAAATLNSVVFSNASPTSTQSHTLVARVVDERTGVEYTANDMNASLGSYPITWNFSVKPQNQAPSVAFGTMTTMTCPTTVGTTKSGCTVPSDTLFTVKINLASDDFYTLPANEANFNYSIRLYENGVNIQTCTKAGYSVPDPLLIGAADVNGADGYDCQLRINSYNGSGPFSLSSRTYQIQAEISDNGSPITGAAATSSTLYWSFQPTTGVTETNTVPTLAGWSFSGAATEGVTNGLNFSVNITDAERDNHTYAIKYCPDGPCLTPVTLTTGSITRTTNANPYALSVAYTLPEDFLLNLTGLNCHTKKRGQTCAVNFFITVTDVPNTAVPLTATSGVLPPSTITNANPAPILNLSTPATSPTPSAFTTGPSFAFVGHPISITNNPSGILTDASTVVAEKTYRYQWFVKNSGTFLNAYTAIEGATSNNLVWTPSYIKELNIGADNPFYIMLCVEDQPTAAVPTVNIVDSTCSDVLPLAGPWTVTVRNNISVTHDLSTAPTSSELAIVGGPIPDKGTETAVWYATPTTYNAVTSSASYVAMIDNNQNINVKKVLVTSTGGIDKINTTSIVSFKPFPGATVVDTVKNLSITGTASELYIAYLASETGSPASFFPQVRRISLSTGKLVPNNHQGIFGFDYDGLDILESCTPAGTCLVTKNATNTTIQFATSGAYGGNFVLGTPNGPYAVDFTLPVDSNSICSNCSGVATALQLQNLINTSTDSRLAGYYADANGTDTVTIYGSAQNDYFNAATDPVAAPMIAGQLGKIYISGANWYLPFINKSLGGAYIDNLSVYSGVIGDNMASTIETLLTPTPGSGLETIGAVTQFDNGLDSMGNYWIAIVRTSGSAGRLYNVHPTAYSVVGPYSILPGEALLNVRLAASTTNVFVGSKTALGPIKLSVFDINGASLAQFAIDNLPNVDPLSDTEDYFNATDMSSYRIVPYGTEARIFAISNGGTADYKLYLARLRNVSGTWTISCGDCKPVSQLARNLSPFVSLAVAPIRTKPASTLDPNYPLYRLSTDGGVSNQGIKDVAFVSFGQFENPAGGCDPALGVFNVEGEAIGSSTIFIGPNPNEDAGLFRSPFVKN